MTSHTCRLIQNATFIATAALVLTLMASGAPPQASKAATNTPQSGASSGDRWLHVRVSNPDAKEETVRVNVPLELAERVLPTINRDRLHNGKVRVDQIDSHG